MAFIGKLSIIFHLAIILIISIVLSYGILYLIEWNNYVNTMSVSENNIIDLEQLKSGNGLIVFRPDTYDGFFTADDNIKSVSQSLSGIDDIKKYMYYFEYCESEKYLMTAIDTFEDSCGMCESQAILFCTLAKIKGYQCYVIANNSHAISLVKYDGYWHPFDSTGNISNQKKMDAFIENVYLMYDEDERYQHWTA